MSTVRIMDIEREKVEIAILIIKGTFQIEITHSLSSLRFTFLWKGIFAVTSHS